MSDGDQRKRSQDIGEGLSILATIFLCCLIVGVLTYAWVNHRGPDSDSATQYEERADRDKKTICVGRVGALLAECEAEQERAAEQSYQAQQDLNAQRKMALWALWMFFATALTTILTVWALWFVRGTLLATRDALKDTGDATKAMVRQNELTERAQMPYPAIEEKYLEGGKIHLKIRNFGQTPARKFAYAIKSGVHGAVVDMRGLNSYGTDYVIDLAPGQTHHIEIPIAPTPRFHRFVAHVLYHYTGNDGELVGGNRWSLHLDEHGLQFLRMSLINR